MKPSLPQRAYTALTDAYAAKASESRIGQILIREGFRYRVVNLTRQNRAHWKLKHRVLRQLREEFEREGNMFI